MNNGRCESTARNDVRTLSEIVRLEYLARIRRLLCVHIYVFVLKYFVSRIEELSFFSHFSLNRYMLEEY